MRAPKLSDRASEEPTRQTGFKADPSPGLLALRGGAHHQPEASAHLLCRIAEFVIRPLALRLSEPCSPADDRSTADGFRSMHDGVHDYEEARPTAPASRVVI